MKYLYCFLCISITFIYSQGPLFIEQEHRVYSFLSHMETYGFISLEGVKPYTSSYIQIKLKKLKKQRLSVENRQWLESFESEFFLVSQQKKSVQPFWTSKGFSHSWQSVTSSGFDESKEFLSFHKENENYLLASIRLQSEIMLKNSSANLIATEYGGFGKFNDFYISVLKQDYSISDKNSILTQNSRFLTNKWSNDVVNSGSLESADHSRGYLAHKTKHTLFWLGRIPFEIGSGESGKFVLNGFQTSVPTSLGFSLDFWKIRYQGLHASLTAPELMVTLEENMNGALNSYRKAPDKFLTSHRFELDLSENFQIHYNELIVYGNRSLDLNYVNPFSFLRPLEHELGDRDNAIITLGGKLKIPSLHLMGYTDFILDEWKLDELDAYWSDKKSWWANKHGNLTGITWANHGIQVWAEYVAIAPWVYTHKFDVNRYTHDASPLGYKLGPNSQTMFYKMAYQYNPQLRLEISHKREQKGQNYSSNERTLWNIGGDIFKGHIARFGELTETRTFLEGDLLKRQTTEIKLRYDFNHYVKMESSYTIHSNENNLLMLYFSIRY